MGAVRGDGSLYPWGDVAGFGPPAGITVSAKKDTATIMIIEIMISFFISSPWVICALVVSNSNAAEPCLAGKSKLNAIMAIPVHIKASNRITDKGLDVNKKVQLLF